jgi:hypothetical protein
VAAAVGGGWGSGAVSRPLPALAAVGSPRAAAQSEGGAAPTPGSAASSGAAAAAGPGARGAAPGRAPALSAPLAAAPDVVPQGSGVQPQQAWYDGIAGSPSSSSGPFFAWGHTGATCNQGCEVLFRSDDEGRSWHNVGARGLLPGRVLVPPTFPTDPTLFAMTSGGVLLSHDAGATWEVPPGGPLGVHGGGAAAVMPVPGDGHPHLAFDAGALQVGVLDGDSGAVATYQVSLPATSITSLGYAGQTLLVAVVAPDPTSSAPPGAVWVCQGQPCAAAAGSSQSWRGGTLLLQPVAERPGTLLVLDGGSRESSTTDGVSFTAEVDTGLAASGLLAASARWVAGAAHLLAEASTAGGAQASLVRAAGGSLLHSLPNGRAAALLLLPGDLILAAGSDVDGSSAPGLRCSHDLGLTWAAAC